MLYTSNNQNIYKNIFIDMETQNYLSFFQIKRI